MCHDSQNELVYITVLDYAIDTIRFLAACESISPYYFSLLIACLS